jgi:predicted metal-binding transcription factor (methanogenesis marker protein 9)
MPKRVDPKDKHQKSGFEFTPNLGLIWPRRGVDHVALQKEYRERTRLGRGQMSDFQAWLVWVCRYMQSTAVQVRRRVWAAIQETEGEPWLKLDDTRLSGSYRKKTAMDLRKWAIYLSETDRGDEALKCLKELFDRRSDDDETLESFAGHSIPAIRGRRGGRVHKKRQG